MLLLTFPLANGKSIENVSNKRTTKPNKKFVFLGTVSIQTAQSINDVIHCDICRNAMTEPFITCAECPRQFRACLKCFASGAEHGDHLNSHSYSVTHDNVRVFRGSDWMAHEERRLLKLIEHFGFGNWIDIARALRTRSADECKNHYLNNYFGGIFWQACELTKYPYKRPTTPYLYRHNVIDPPRHLPESAQSKHMAGYRFARSDFDTPYDNSAESLVSHLDGGDDECVSEALQCAMVRAYNNRLR